jgi:hypothetical protein
MIAFVQKNRPQLPLFRQAEDLHELSIFPVRKIPNETALLRDMLNQIRPSNADYK